MNNNIVEFNNFKELNSFKHKVNTEKLGPIHKPYTAYKRRAWIYRAIFSFFCLVFLVLEYFLYKHTLSWTASLVFGNQTAIKGFVHFFCLGLSGGAGYMAIRMEPEKEAARELVRWTKRQILLIYRKHHIRYNVKAFLAFGESWRKKAAFKHQLSETYHAVANQQLETWHLFERIFETKALDPATKETLLNQAICELKEKLEGILSSYQQTSGSFLLN